MTAWAEIPIMGQEESEGRLELRGQTSHEVCQRKRHVAYSVRSAMIGDAAERCNP